MGAQRAVHESLYGSYMDPMWGRSGPVAGGHGSVGMENGALAQGANVFYINTSIFHLKKNEMIQNVNISFEIYSILYGI